MLGFLFEFQRRSVGLPCGTLIGCHFICPDLGVLLEAFQHCGRCHGGMAHGVGSVAEAVLGVLGRMGVVCGGLVAVAGKHVFGMCGRGGLLISSPLVCGWLWLCQLHTMEIPFGLWVWFAVGGVDFGWC